jgi:type I site-specific restriction-modification system R (restriction) subunit
MIYYVLLEIGWEYNDEYYYRSENYDGRPKKIFENPEEANQELINKTLEHVNTYSVESLVLDRSYRGNDYLQNFKTRFPTISETIRINVLPLDVQKNIVDWLSEIDIVFYEVVPCCVIPSKNLE